MAARRVPGEVVKEGDVLIVLGTEHPVTRIEPFNGPSSIYDNWRLAHSGTDWNIALVPGQGYWRVDRT